MLEGKHVHEYEIMAACKVASLIVFEFVMYMVGAQSIRSVRFRPVPSVRTGIPILLNSILHNEIYYALNGRSKSQK